MLILFIQDLPIGTPWCRGWRDCGLHRRRSIARNAAPRPSPWSLCGTCSPAADCPRPRRIGRRSRLKWRWALDPIRSALRCSKEHILGWSDRIWTLLLCPILREHPVLTLVGVVLVGGFDELGLLPPGLQRNRIPIKILERKIILHWLRHTSTN